MNTLFTWKNLRTTIGSLVICASIFSSFSVFADTTNDTRLTTLDSSGTTSAPDFKVKHFNSCEDAETAVSDFLSSYYKKHPYYPRPFRGGVMLEDAIDSVKATSPAPNSGKGGGSEPAKDVSQTNVQIAWVDESETVKTDGKNIYYFNASDRAIYIVAGANTGKTELIRKIVVPETYSNPELYVANGKLVVLATKYNQGNSYGYWYDRSTKTAVIVYDLSDLDALNIDRYYQIDGSLENSRRIGDYVYVLSRTDFAFQSPLYFNSVGADGSQTLNKEKVANDLTIEKIIPRILEITKAGEKERANYKNKDGYNGRYVSKTGKASNCEDLEYILPDEKTMESYNFSPTITNITAISLKDPTEKAKTKVLFGDTGEVMMSQNSLYLSSRLYTSNGWTCPIYARCFAPVFWGSEEDTLVHRFSIDASKISYASTAVVPGTLMNRYAMDESDGKLRIVTQKNGAYDTKTNSYPRSNQVSILDAKDLSALGSLDKIAEGENFQSARFIGNRLYLVTFQQIDPLFVIDVSTNTPKILGELKMPGYSTYLHPYGEGKLIGIGYNIITNQWGGTQNAGIKVDLYDVSDVSNPKQLFTKTLGSVGSNSDALHNPKLFVWNEARKILMLPVTLMESANDTTNLYRSKDAFQGVVSLKIDAMNGISEVARTTHIDTSGVAAAREKECEQYAKVVSTPPKCEKLLGGGEYCPNSNSQYVPSYCYQSSTNGEWFANHLWEYSNEFIDRVVYFDNHFYAISNKKITGQDMDAGWKVESDLLFSPKNSSGSTSDNK